MLGLRLAIVQAAIAQVTGIDMHAGYVAPNLSSNLPIVHLRAASFKAGTEPDCTKPNPGTVADCDEETGPPLEDELPPRDLGSARTARCRSLQPA